MDCWDKEKEKISGNKWNIQIHPNPIKIENCILPRQNRDGNLVFLLFRLHSLQNIIPPCDSLRVAFREAFK